jgi:predicted nucleotidyltransferase
LLVEIDEPDPVEQGDLLLDIWDELELFFQQKVDWLTNFAINSPVLKAKADNSETFIDGGSGQKVLV